MKRGAWLAVQGLVGVLVAWYLLRFVLANWTELGAAGTALKWRTGPLLLAGALVLGTYALLIAAWRAVLVGWREQLGYGTAARIWTVSNLARYVPGRIWQIAGMAALAQQAGVSPWAAAGSAVAVQLLAIATGTLVTAAFAPGIGQPLLMLGAGLAAAGCAALLASDSGAAAATAVLRRLTGRDLELRPVRPGPLLLSAGITSAAWVLYGVALWASVRGLTDRNGLDLQTAVGVFTGSYVAGLVNVFTPGGIGTREAVLVSWLTGPLGPAAAAVVTIGSRLLMTATELLAALITLPLTHRPDGQHA